MMKSVVATELRRSKETFIFRFKITVSEASPWPALKIEVHALLNDKNVTLCDLDAVQGGFSFEKSSYKADALDILLVRTLKQQPQLDRNTYIAGARDFAAVLALLRQHSANCEYQECPRVAAVEILSEPALATLELLPAPRLAQPEFDKTPRIIGRRRFRCPESGGNLGDPLYHSASLWAFNRHITPAPSLPNDELLRKAFLSSAATHEYEGDEALELMCRAREAANAKNRDSDWTVQWKIPPQSDAFAVPQICVEPLRKEVRVAFDDLGDLVIEQNLVTPDGTVVQIPKCMQGNESRPANTWIEHGGKYFRLPSPKLPVSPKPDMTEVNSGRMQLAGAVSPFALPQKRKINGDAIPEFLKDELPRLKAAGARIDKNVESAVVCESLKPSVRLSAESRDGSPLVDGVQAQFFFEPATGESAKTEIEAVEVLAAAARDQKYLRMGNTFVRVDREAVVRARRSLQEMLPFQDGEATVCDEQIPELIAWTRAASNDSQSPWNVYIAEAVDGAHKVKDEPATIRFKMDVDEEDETWFTLHPEFDHGGEVLTEDDLRKLVKEGTNWFRDSKGQWVRTDKNALERFEKGVESTGIQRWHGGRGRKGFRFKATEREQVTEIFSVSGTLEHSEIYQKFIDQLNGFERIQPQPTPKGMPLTLRPYQQQGFEWLTFLAQHDLNGILADDMGLGKTAQTIALLTRMKEEHGQSPSLIVTPTSLLDNWKNEVAKFSPTLSVMVYRGSLRRRDELRQKIFGYDIVLGTYATIRNDASLLREMGWRHIILDEAHFIKNSAAATTKALKTLPSQHRLALTGTPIQNRLAELWSLFDFLMPGFLGRQMKFREQYEEPILRVQAGRAETKEQQKDGENAAESLRERIQPFVLRRLKTDVAKDLPPKIENDVFCPLCPEQAALYRGFCDSAEAKEAVNKLTQGSGENAQTAILAALTSLRKICNHADLMCLPKNSGRQRIEKPFEGYEKRSGKLEALGELLQQCREGGHRALIFCQLTSMMDLIGHFLADNQMKYLRLDGETAGTGRQALVEQFNTDTSYDAFMISTRAGGAGLNLTGADTVIFYDHDWNPANDQQAQDRAYRLGQKKTVNVYRLICKGTLEEKILRRQTQKKLLAGSIVQVDPLGMKELTRDELLNIFTLTEEPEPMPQQDNTEKERASVA